MMQILRYLGQGVCYALFVAFVGYFSTAPAYVHLAPDQALVKLSFSHAGRVKEPCRARSAEELARLAPNMRAPMECTRARSPVEVRLELDGKLVYQARVEPAGLARDGPSSVYRRFVVPAGRHRLRAQLKDDAGLADFNYRGQADVELKPAQVFVVDFDARGAGFVLK